MVDVRTWRSCLLMKNVSVFLAEIIGFTTMVLCDFSRERF